MCAFTFFVAIIISFLLPLYFLFYILVSITNHTIVFVCMSLVYVCATFEIQRTNNENSSLWPIVREEIEIIFQQRNASKIFSQRYFQLFACYYLSLCPNNSDLLLMSPYCTNLPEAVAAHHIDLFYIDNICVRACICLSRCVCVCVSACLQH